MSFKSPGVNLKGQFNLKNTDPIDGRYVITTAEEYEEMTKLSSGSAVYLYPGLMFTVTTELTLSKKSTFVVPNVYKTDANDNKIVVPGVYQIDADGQTVNRVPKFTIVNNVDDLNNTTNPNNIISGNIGDVCIVYKKK